MRARRTSVLACLLAAAVLGAGCDDGSGSLFPARRGGGPDAQLGRVEQTVDQARSVVVQGRQVHGDNGTVQVHGRMSWKDGDVSAFTMTGTGMSGGLFGATSGGATSGGSTSAVTTGDTVYVRLGGTLARAFGGKQWLKMTYGALAAREGAVGEVMEDTMSRAHNPVSSVALLRASGDVTLAGTEIVRGQRCRHYVGTVDATRITADSDPNLPASEVSALRTQLRSLGMTTEQIDLWVNAKDLPLRVTTTINSSQGNYATVYDYSRYGADVDIRIPPDSATLDLDGLLKALPSA